MASKGKRVKRKSAGILLFRRTRGLQVFLVHPGGPFWKGKELGAWTIPKGEYSDSEEPLAAAIREFEEETGKKLAGDFIELPSIVQKSGKEVQAWALEGDLDAEAIVSNTMKLEWPYKSGKWITIPEVDKGSWFSIQEAERYINEAQIELLRELSSRLS